VTFKSFKLSSNFQETMATVKCIYCDTTTHGYPSQIWVCDECAVIEQQVEDKRNAMLFAAETVRLAAENAQKAAAPKSLWKRLFGK